MGESGGFGARYRVDQVPWYWWLPMQLYGWLVGTPFFLYSALVAITSKINYLGHPLEPDQNYIYCFWHRHIFSFNCLSVRMRRFSFFVHPLWYMAPSHVFARLRGQLSHV